MNNTKMLYFERIDVSEGNDANKTSASTECDICHYWYFLYWYSYIAVSFNQMFSTDVMIFNDVYEP